MEKLCSYKLMHCDEIQVNMSSINIMEKGVISAANDYKSKD